MSNTATLEIDGKKHEFPIIKGTENELGINIKALRGGTGGLITIDPGYKNTGSCESAITYLDGEQGILRYRGYSIEDLAEKADFLETAYLLIFGELPTAAQLEKFDKDIKAESHVDEEMKKILDGFPKYKGKNALVSANLMKAFQNRHLFPTKDHVIYSFRHSFEKRMQEANI